MVVLWWELHLHRVLGSVCCLNTPFTNPLGAPACEKTISGTIVCPEPMCQMPRVAGGSVNACCFILAGATTSGCWISSSGLGPSPTSLGPALTREEASLR